MSEKRKNDAVITNFKHFCPQLLEMDGQLRYTEKNRESFGEWLVWQKISRKLGKLPINWTGNKKS